MSIFDDIQRDFGAIRERLEAELYTQPTGGNADAPPLTLETLRQLMASVPKAPPPLRLHFVEPLPIYGPIKTHRKRRIAKKWRKRYGVKVVGYDRYLGDQVYVDSQRGVGYCHADVGLRLENELNLYESNTR